jgi:hypothetical protein
MRGEWAHDNLDYISANRKDEHVKFDRYFKLQKLGKGGIGGGKNFWINVQMLIL